MPNLEIGCVQSFMWSNFSINVSLEAADTVSREPGLMLCASWFQPARVTLLVLLDRDAVRWAGYVIVSPA